VQDGRGFPRFDPATNDMRRVIVGLIAVACTATGAVLAWRYPIAYPLVLALFATWIACCFRWPLAWLAVIPALLPVLGFATWTGWFAFEELDLLVLGAAAGGYARLAWGMESSKAGPRHARSTLSPLIVVVIALLAVSYASALYRGISDAGGFVFDWIGSYDSAMNSIRIGKSFAAALLLWPLLRSAFRTDERRSIDLLACGIGLGLGLASVAAVWERMAFTDLLNFSSDYRTTALFWEMHVGGAAFDGFLALTVPFIVWELRRSRNHLHVGLVIGLAVLATYACLTTFSRGVYVAVPAGFATLAVLLLRGRPAARRDAAQFVALRTGVLAIIATVALYFSFHHGGYRALLAFGATVAVSFWVAPTSRAATLQDWAVAFIAGVTAGVAVSAVAMHLSKGPYVAFGLALAWNTALVLWPSDGASHRGLIMRLAAFVLLVVVAASVALHWGGMDAFEENTLALALVLGLTLWSAMSGVPLFPVGLKTRAMALGALCLLAGGVVVFAGGAYMSDRFSTSSGDFELRMKHWRDGIGMLRTGSDWWLGKGLGRFPGDYSFNVTDSTHPGAFALRNEPGERFMALAGPRYPTSWGDLFRIAQRVRPVPGTYTAVLDVRSPLDTELHLEVCEQHLLYNAACATGTVTPRASPTWQRISVVMDGRQLSGGSWYAPRLAFFAMAVGSSGQVIDIRDVALMGPDGRDLIVNGDFADGMARWIPISERYHLPWHAKNLALNVLFDQGITGLVPFLLLVVAVLWRLAFGAARTHPIAPFLAASVVGFVAVGAFDSLLDVPRVAFLFYLLLFISLALPPAHSSAS
jgi:hypothetical protein